MSTNIKFGDTSYYTSYIQSFLRDNYSTDVLATNAYDRQTHQALIKYLNQPNVSTLVEAETTLLSKYNELSTLFVLNRKDDSLVFTSKIINKTTSDFIANNIEDIKKVVYDLGWEIENFGDYIDWTYDINNDNSIDIIDRTLIQNYINIGSGLTPEQKEKADINMDGIINQEDLDLLSDYIENNKLFIKVKAQDRENFFPNKDMLNFVNLFNNDFYFRKAIRDDVGINDYLHDSTGEYKVSITECKPGTTYTIMHSSGSTQRLVIGSTSASKVTIETTKLENVLDIQLNPGQPVLYTTSSYSEETGSTDAKYLLIQCASNIEGLSNLEEKTEQIALGNVNLDYYKDPNGEDDKTRPKIDNLDRKLLSDYIFYPEGDPNRPIFTPRQLTAANITLRKDSSGNPIIDQQDLQMLVDYLEGRILSLGFVEYKYYVPRDLSTINNVASLLIMEGNQIEKDTGETTQAAISIHHPRTSTIIQSKTDTFQKSQFSNCKINISGETTENYDEIEIFSNIIRIEGASHRESHPTLSNPKEIKVVSDINISVNSMDPVNYTFSGNRLVKVEDIFDYFYQSQGKNYIHKEISEEYSNTINWERVETQVPGKFYLRTKESTSLKPPSSLNETPKILCNKLETVDPISLLNVNSGYNECISLDLNGKIMIYVRNWDSLQLNDMLYWLGENPFYVYGQAKQTSNILLGDIIFPITLQEGENTLVIGTHSLLPNNITFQSSSNGITNSWIEEITSTFNVTKSTLGINFYSFINDPWIVHKKFMSYLLGQSITPYSRSEDITYVQNLVKEIYPTAKKNFIPGDYSQQLKDLVEQFQRSRITYDRGDINLDGKVNKYEIDLVSAYLKGEISLSDEQLKLADVDGDTQVTENDLNMISKEYYGVNDTIKVFKIPFTMGYLDPSTEYEMLKIISAQNTYKGLLRGREIGW